MTLKAVKVHDVICGISCFFQQIFIVNNSVVFNNICNTRHLVAIHKGKVFIGKNYRQMWDLYINNATCEPTALSTKTADDATADFVTEEAVFYQNGTWEFNAYAVNAEPTPL